MLHVHIFLFQKFLIVLFHFCSVPVLKGFCEKCIAESNDKTPGDVSTVNGFGRKFYGSAKPCSVCGSVIRTLWWTAVDLPVIPLGSYRYKTIVDDDIGMSRFWARRTSLQWNQVIKTWIVGFLAAAGIFAAIYLYKFWKSS